MEYFHSQNGLRRWEISENVPHRLREGDTFGSLSAHLNIQKRLAKSMNYRVIIAFAVYKTECNRHSSHPLGKAISLVIHWR